jgi:hypothetical protein
MAKPSASGGDGERREKKNKIHLSLFVDGQDVTLLEEFNTPEEAIAAAREFLGEHHPEPTPEARRKRAPRPVNEARPRPRTSRARRGRSGR